MKVSNRARSRREWLDQARSNAVGAALVWTWDARAVSYLDLADRSVKGQMKQADRLGARRAVILDSDGVHLRDMESGERADVDLGRVVEALTR